MGGGGAVSQSLPSPPLPAHIYPSQLPPLGAQRQASQLVHRLASGPHLSVCLEEVGTVKV